ncbi:MAG: hypothetical protein ACRDSJ_21885 [Rubrobacteraceae bacterium]
MVNVFLKVGSGEDCFETSVQAESIRRAVSVAEARYPGREVRTIFPLDTETFFVHPEARVVEFELAESA